MVRRGQSSWENKSRTNGPFVRIFGVVVILGCVAFLNFDSLPVFGVNATVSRQCAERWRGISAMLSTRSSSPNNGALHQSHAPGSKVKQTDKVYYSSDWERMWLENIGTWQNHQICEALSQQREEIMKFMATMCSAETETAWCLVDDSYHPFWYNTKTGAMSIKEPRGVKAVHPLSPVQPSDPTIFSRFEWKEPDGSLHTEYIEPLVGHLRHPLTGCERTFSKNKVSRQFSI